MSKEIKPEDVLDKQELMWDEDVEMINENALVAWKHCIKAMKEYAEIKVQEYKDSLKPKKNIWGADIKETDEFFKRITKDAGPRD